MSRNDTSLLQPRTTRRSSLHGSCHPSWRAGLPAAAGKRPGRVPRLRKRAAFTLVELLVVIALIALLSALIFPVVRQGIGAGKSAACKSNLHQLHAAHMMYLDDHGGRFFSWRTDGGGDGVQWYWGLERGGAGEGSRVLDKSKAVLAPYFDHVGGVEVCPAFPYQTAGFKRKFDVASYGYGINAYMLAGASPISTIAGVRSPSETIAWGDSAQVNTWQAPASPRNPMIEEWYRLSAETPPNMHFRHGRKLNAVMADGSGRSFEPTSLDPRCDGLTGYIEAPRQDYYLRLVK